MSSIIPRRARLDLMTPEEKTIFHLRQQIETLGAHPILTEAQNLLAQAADKLGDWHDGLATPQG